MSFQECELAILRKAVDEASTQERQNTVNSPAVRKMIAILESFLRRKKLICYGGISINAALDKDDQFYDFQNEIPDYDFFSKRAMEDAIELADLYHKKGFEEVEAKAGMHHGTYKVFVNFIGIADITAVHKDVFDSLRKEAIVVEGIHYCPPNYLRMSMYLELSRPRGDLSRWEKVQRRLTLLNQKYPLRALNCEVERRSNFQRSLSERGASSARAPSFKGVDEAALFTAVKRVLVDSQVVFFGGFAISLYAQYMPSHQRQQVERVPDFDVLSIDPEATAEKVATVLREEVKVANYKEAKSLSGSRGKVAIEEHAPIGEIVSRHFRVLLGKQTVVTIYEPLACHSFNEIVLQEGGDLDSTPIRIATIDTMLSLYLAFLYTKRSYYDTNRIACMAQFLFEVQQKNKLNQHGLLKRFTLTCYGKQKTLQGIRAEKTAKYHQLKRNKKSLEYKEWFLRYRPSEGKRNDKSGV